MRTLLAIALFASIAALATNPALLRAQKNDEKGAKEAAKEAKEAKKARDAAWTKADAVLKDPKAPLEDAIKAVESLRGQLDHDNAIKLLEYFDVCDNAWTSNKKDKLGRVALGPRPIESYKVARAILKEIRSMSAPDEVLKFEAELEMKETFSMRKRTAMMDAIEHNWEDPRCAGLLMTYARDNQRDGDMRVLAIDHLANHTSAPDVLEALLVTLRDRSWRVRDASIVALLRGADKDKDRITIALINALSTEQGKLRKHLADALASINGVDLGTNPDEWIDWFKRKNADAQGLPPKSPNPNRGTRAKVFETEVFSDRYVFLIDTSVSMLKKITEEEKEELKKSITSTPGEEKDPRRPLDWSKISTKLDLAREEIIRSLEVMDPKVTKFTMVKFNTDAGTWKDELVPTDVKNVAEATDWLRAAQGGQRTNVYGAINAALDLSEMLAGREVESRKGKPKKGDKKDGPVITGPHRDEALPDTLFIYSDGFATNGKYMGGDEREWAGKSQSEKAKLYGDIMKFMLEEISDRNRISRMTIHTVGVGDPQDFTTLGALARKCGGKYTALGRK